MGHCVSLSGPVEWGCELNGTFVDPPSSTSRKRVTRDTAFERGDRTPQCSEIPHLLSTKTTLYVEALPRPLFQRPLGRSGHGQHVDLRQVSRHRAERTVRCRRAKKTWRRQRGCRCGFRGKKDAGTNAWPYYRCAPAERRSHLGFHLHRSDAAALYQ